MVILVFIDRFGELMKELDSSGGQKIVI